MEKIIPPAVGQEFRSLGTRSLPPHLIKSIDILWARKSRLSLTATENTQSTLRSEKDGRNLAEMSSFFIQSISRKIP